MGCPWRARQVLWYSPDFQVLSVPLRAETGRRLWTDHLARDVLLVRRNEAGWAGFNSRR